MICVFIRHLVMKGRFYTCWFLWIKNPLQQQLISLSRNYAAILYFCYQSYCSTTSSPYKPPSTLNSSYCHLIHAQYPARAGGSFKMLKEVRAAKTKCATMLYSLEKLFNIAQIDTTGPALSTPAPLSPLPTKLQHLSLGQPQRAESFLMIFPLSDTP